MKKDGHSQNRYFKKNCLQKSKMVSKISYYMNPYPLLTEQAIPSKSMSCNSSNQASTWTFLLGCLQFNRNNSHTFSLQIQLNHCVYYNHSCYDHWTTQICENYLFISMEICLRIIMSVSGNKSIVNTRNEKDSHQKYYKNVEKWKLMNRNVINGDDEARAQQLASMYNVVNAVNADRESKFKEILNSHS